MKKKLALLLAGMMVFSMLGGCGKEEENAGDIQSGQETEGVQESKETVESVNLIDVKVEDYVTMGEYKNLEMSFDAKETFTQEDVEQLALSVYNGYVTAEAGGVKDRAAVLGDTVNIDYEGKQDGVAFSGGTAQNQQLTLGSDSFIDGFEDGLVGVTPGETVDLNLKFPETYSNNPDMAGAEVVFTVTVNFIYPTEASQMTDAVVASMENQYFGTVQELEDYCREYLEYNVNDVYVSGKQNAALNALLSVAEIADAPEGLVQNYYDSIYASLSSQAASYGFDIETFCVYFVGTDADTYVTAYAKESAKQSMAVQYVANAENLNVSDEELEQCIKTFAEENKVTAEEVRASDDEEMLREYFMFTKVLEFLVENGNVTEIPAE